LNGDNVSARGPGREIHVSDLAAVVLRHWRIVALLAMVVAVGAYFQARRVVPQYQSKLTVQIGSPKQMFAHLDDFTRVDELALRTDPVLSEALILTTQGLALRVVKAQGLQLDLADPRDFRGDVIADVVMDSLARPANYHLVLKGSAGYELRNAANQVLATGNYDQRVVAPGYSFRVLPSPLPRTIDFTITRPEVAAAWVSAGLAYRAREGTTAVDVMFTGSDRTLVPYVLNEAALQLREAGVERVRAVSQRRRDYVAQQVDQADSQYQAKLRELQAFKEGQQITDLTSEEQSIVNAIQNQEQEKVRLQIKIATLRDAVGRNDSISVERLNRLAAIEGIDAKSPLAYHIQNLLELFDKRRALTAGAMGLREENPQVQGHDQQIREEFRALRQSVSAMLQSLTAQEAGIDGRIAEKRAVLRTFPGKETRIAGLQLENNILYETYRYLLGQYQSAQMEMATIAPYITILEGASPAYAIGTTLKQKIMLGLLVGVLLGLAGAFFLEYLDQTIKSANDIERVLGIPVLALVPYDAKLASANGNGRRSPIVVMSALGADEPAAEAYRALRTNVTFVGAEKALQFMAVTSPGPGEGKSTTATNLAAMLAQGGHHTILIDGDLRRPLVHRAFGLVQEPGLTDVLVGSASAREAIRPEVAPGLDVLPAGPTPPNPSELLGSDAMHQLIADLRRQYDYIVMDTPPVLPVTDATVVATLADATILAIRSGDTEEVSAQRAVEQLRRVNGRIAGAVLNAVSPRKDQYYTYYSYKKDAPTRGPARSLRARLTNLL
jgi:capsular exopolysaccharide synthesis family protein